MSPEKKKKKRHLKMDTNCSISPRIHLSESNWIVIAMCCQLMYLCLAENQRVLPFANRWRAKTFKMLIECRMCAKPFSFSFYFYYLVSIKVECGHYCSSLFITSLREKKNIILYRLVKCKYVGRIHNQMESEIKSNK